jgi:hypothetical protein
MRHPSYFQLDKTTVEERRRVMTQFVAEVRAALDTAAPPGRRRYLGVRVPGYLAEHDRLGLHLPALVEAGVEMVTLSAFYYTVFNMDLALIRALVPDAALYVEVTHCTVQGKRITGVGYDDFTFRRTTPQQFYTAAHQGYARGCDGVSAFNFVYYREHGTEGRGPFNEPPFEVFRHLGDPAWLARQPQHYLYARGWRVSSLPRRLKAGETATLTLDLAAPAGAWPRGGRLRLQSDQPFGGRRWRVCLNGVELPPTPETSEPYPNPYPPLLGTPETLRAFVVPPSVPKEGRNALEVTLLQGEGIEISVVDLALA